MADTGHSTVARYDVVVVGIVVGDALVVTACLIGLSAGFHFDSIYSSALGFVLAAALCHKILAREDVMRLLMGVGVAPPR